ncbi:MAG TPA: hypothetical protein VEI03_10790 [Stellaceae bacterium]|nr:hypothetical protein [Stellaceae bacterium]
MRKATRTLILAAALMAVAACSGSGENKQVPVVDGVPLGGIGW